MIISNLSYLFMNILVIGNGAREHAICYSLCQSSKLSKLFCIPGNYGISKLAECISLDTNNFDKLYGFVIKKQIDLIEIDTAEDYVGPIINYFKKRGKK